MFRVRPPERQPRKLEPTRLPQLWVMIPTTPAEEDKPAEHAGSLFTTRSLLIISLSIVVGVMAGLGAGIPAGLASKATGPAWAIAIGFIGGLSAALPVGLTVAGALHLLVGKKPG